jgi:hypothetical protein
MVRLSLLLSIALLAAYPAAATARTPAEMVERLGFPATRHGFVRTEANASGKADFALVTYRKAPGIQLEIGLVQILDMSPKEHYWVRRAELLRGKSDPGTLAEGDYRLEGRTRSTGCWGKYLVDGPAGRQIAAVITFDFGDWDVHIRAEYPEAQAATAERQIRVFLRSLAWERLK